MVLTDRAGAHIALFFAFLCLLGTAGGVAAEEGSVSIQDLAGTVGAHLEYDPFIGLGRLMRGTTTVSFAIGSDRVVHDYQSEIAIDPPTKRDGRVLLTERSADQVSALFRRPDRDPDQPYVAAIFIDPGHGGRDPGTIGRHTIENEPLVLYEKDIVLEVSLRLRDLLADAYPDRPIVLSRESDEYLTLDARTDMANEIPIEENEFVVYISIHANASFNSRATGFEVWFLPPEQRRTLIQPEDLDSDRRSIHAILNSMKEEEVSVQSAMLGNELLAGLESSVGRMSPNRGLKQENWAVVRNALMPSVLVELGFVTNGHEAQLLSDPAYLRNLSYGLYTGVRNFIDLFESSNASDT